MGLKNALKKIVKKGDKKDKKAEEEEEEISEEIGKEPQEAEAETTIESGASPSPDEVEEEPARSCRPGMGGLTKQRSFNRRERRLRMAQEVEANLIEGEDCEEKEEQENMPLKDGRRRRRARRGESENHDGPDMDGSARHSQRSTSRSLDRASKHTQPSNLDGSSKHSNPSLSDDGEEVVMITIPRKDDVSSKSNLRRTRNNSNRNSRSHSGDRLSQRASSRERPAMSRAASRERLSGRMAANRSASRERGARRSENGERMRRSSSRDRGQRRSRKGDVQDVAPSSQADGKEVVDLSETTKTTTPAVTKPDGTIEAGGELSSSIRSSRSGGEVSSSIRSNRSEGGREQGIGKRSTSRGRGRPDRGLSKSNHDPDDSADRLGRSNHSTVDRRRGSSRERRPRRPPRSENSSADVAKPPLPPTKEASSTPPSANGGESLSVPSPEINSKKEQEEAKSPPPKEESREDANTEIDSNTSKQPTEDSNEKVIPNDSGDLLNMIPYEETKAEEEINARQSVGVVFHSEEPQEDKSEEEETTEEIDDNAEMNPALALLGLLAERDTPETREKNKESNSPSCDTSGSGETSDSPGTAADISQTGESAEATTTDGEDIDLGISLPSVKVTIAVGIDNDKKDSSKLAETDPKLSFLGHIGANQLIDEKNSNGATNAESVLKSGHQVENSDDFFRGPENDGASPDTSMDVSQSSRLSRKKNSTDDQEFDKRNHSSNAVMGNKRVVRRTKSSDGNLSGPSLPPPSLADPNERTKVRRVKRSTVKKEEGNDLPPPSLAPPSLAGDMMAHCNGKKIRRKKAKDGEGNEKALAPPSLAGDLVAAHEGGRARKIRRAKSDSGSDLLSAAELAPPSLAGDFHAAKQKKLSRRREKKAKRFNKLDDDDDDDSLEGDFPVENSEAATSSKPRRGMLSKARSAANVLEKGAKLGKRSSSSRNLFA